MEVLVFDLRAPLAHFRRPDTTASHLTYPFIPRTALRGLVGAILGMEEFAGTAWTGIQLLHPVQTVSQELSYLGKKYLGGSGDTFNRPTAIELVVNPYYRIYYAGDHLRELADRIRERRSHYHTYLGSAFALVFPQYVGLEDMTEVQPEEGKEWRSLTVVPAHAIARLSFVPGVQYGRVGSIHYEHIGQRRFRGAVHAIYEVSGKPVTFVPKPTPLDPPIRFFSLSEGEVICLW